MRTGKLIVKKDDVALRDWWKYPVGPIEGKDAELTMKRGCELLGRINLPYWISSGNLLGIYRDRQLIPHDTDIDVNILLEYDTLEANILQKQIVNAFTANDFVIIRTAVYKNHFMQLAFMDNKTEVIFDIYPFYTKIKPYFAVNINPEGIIEKPLRFVNKLQTITFKGTTYPIPNHLDDFLEWRFGENWKVPAKEKVAWQEESTSLKKWKQ